MASGPLAGVKVVEIAGIGPGPFAGLMLSDMGADVIRVERAQELSDQERQYARTQVLNRGRRSIAADLKTPEGRELTLRLIDQADIVFEPFRAGVAERLGIGPDVCLARKPSLVYGRISGWGRGGPYSQMAGHDVDYIALSGALGAIGRAGDRPLPPLNLVGDFGGGGMLLAFGLVCALTEARVSGQGQVVDAAMVDGAALLMGVFYGWQAASRWNGPRGTNMLDGGAPFYDVYETSDGQYVAVGSIEPKFWEILIGILDLTDDPLFSEQYDTTCWPQMRARLAAIFATRTRAQWWELFKGTDACVAPVLTVAEAPDEEHNIARESFVRVAGVVQPAPAPRMSRTSPAVASEPPLPGEHTAEILQQWLGETG